MRVFGREIRRRWIEPGLPFIIIDPLLSRGWRGAMAWTALFLPAAVLSIAVFSWLSWLVNPPWQSDLDRPSW